MTKPLSKAGLSPWVRGTPFTELAISRFRRFIPVGAGNSITAAQLQVMAAVYPRGCGELSVIKKAGSAVAGLSPWVRGTQKAAKAAEAKARFIPVGAGNS